MRGKGNRGSHECILIHILFFSKLLYTVLYTVITRCGAIIDFAKLNQVPICKDRLNRDGSEYQRIKSDLTVDRRPSTGDRTASLKGDIHLIIRSIQSTDSNIRNA